jgi:transcriptional regulator with XRE-family HTH domain
MVTPETIKKAHQGRNIKRIREILGIKQEVLAHDLGLSQQAVSQIEQKEALDQDILEKVARALKVPAEAIINFDEQAAVNFISNTFNNNSHDQSNFYALNVNPTFNPLDKIIELYERIIKEKNEAIERLEKLTEKSS